MWGWKVAIGNFARFLSIVERKNVKVGCVVENLGGVTGRDDGGITVYD